MTVTTIHINSLFESLAPLVESVAANGLPTDARLIFHGRNTVVAVQSDEGPVNIKAYKVPHIVNRIAYGMLRPSKAERAFNHAMKLISMGFHTPEPIAFIEIRNFGMLNHSYFFSRHIDGAREVRDIADLPQCHAMLREIAALMVGMHSKGILFKDFSPGNLLYTTDREGRRHYMLVDINRMKFGVHDAERLYSMFGRLLNTEELTADLARYYCEESGINPESEQGLHVIKVARSEFRRFNRIKG